MKNTSSNVKVKPLQSRAFTLIEMLVVIAIIALLTGIILTSLTGSKSKARDVKRISDIGNIQVAISLYYDRCKVYPDQFIGVADLTTIKNGCPITNPQVSLASYISTIPTAPSPGAYTYTPLSSNTDYILSATLENYNEVLKDDLDSNGCNPISDNTERVYCLGPK